MSPDTVIDYVCGEGAPAEREAFRERLAQDIDLAVEVAETQALFEDLKALSCEPTGRVAVVVRRAVLRRAELRHPSAQRLGLVGTAWRVAAVALLWLAISWVLFRGADESTGKIATVPDSTEALLPRDALAASPVRSATRGGATRDPELEALLACDYAPVSAPGFRASLARIGELAVPDRFAGWLCAENLLAQLRREYHLRLSADARAQVRRVLSTPDVDDRIAVLADEVAPRLAAVQELPLDDLAFGLRALLAAGSTLDAGRHRDPLRACAIELAARVGALAGGDLALALAALSDVAVVSGDEYADLVGEHAERLAREVLRTPPDGGRPPLLHWGTAASQLADAGRLLQVAPAFGTHAGLAFRARTMLAAHLGERLAVRSETDSPALVAAWSYGFGDLIDRSDADRRLSLWRLQMLRPDYVAMHQLAWSKYPVRRGWAEFQLEIRRLAGLPTPAGTRDAAALLLALSTNVAAPGILEGVRLADL